MIKATDLRIGNIVQYTSMTHGTHHIKIESINDKGINAVAEGEKEYVKYTFRLLEPVPITPELLDKCGSEETFCTNEDQDEIYCYRHKKIFDLKSKDGDLSFDYWTLRHIKFLHQLQNLYFALSGKELTVNIGTPVAS